jgi:hypothetical protein
MKKYFVAVNFINKLLLSHLPAHIVPITKIVAMIQSSSSDLREGVEGVMLETLFSGWFMLAGLLSNMSESSFGKSKLIFKSSSIVNEIGCLGG